MHWQQNTMHLNTPLILGGKNILQKEIIFMADPSRHLLAEFSYIEGLHPPFFDSLSTLKTKIESMLESDLFKETLKKETLKKSLIFFNTNCPTIHPSLLFVFEQFVVSHYFYQKKEKINLPIKFKGQLLLDQNILYSLQQQFELWANLLKKHSQITTVKMKLGKRPWQQEKDLFEMILNEFPNLHFRLDFNQRAENEGAFYLSFLEQFRSSIEYLESPPPSLQNYFPLGLDLGLDRAKSLNQVCALILKPSLLGLAYSLKLSTLAHSQNIKVSFSSCYESPLAHFFMAFALKEYHPIKCHQEYAFFLAYGTWDYVINQNELKNSLQDLAQLAHWPIFNFEDSIIIE